MTLEHNPGEPEFGEHADEAEHNPGEPELGDEESAVAEDEAFEDENEPREEDG